MNIYEKIEAIEKSIISLSGDKATNGKSYISLEKMEKNLSPLFQKHKLFLKKEVTKSSSSCSTYTQEGSQNTTQTKIMYFVDVEATFTFIDTSSGESLDFKFCGSDNKNTNADQCYSSAVSYVRRNFYKTIFNLEIGARDNIAEKAEQKDGIGTSEVPTKEINETPGKKYFVNGEHRELTEDEKPLSKTYYKTLVETLKKKYGEGGFIQQINRIKAKHKISKLTNLTLGSYKDIVRINFDIEQYTKVS